MLIWCVDVWNGIIVISINMWTLIWLAEWKRYWNDVLVCLCIGANAESVTWTPNRIDHFVYRLIIWLHMIICTYWPVLQSNNNIPIKWETLVLYDVKWHGHPTGLIISYTDWSPDCKWLFVYIDQYCNLIITYLLNEKLLFYMTLLSNILAMMEMMEMMEMIILIFFCDLLSSCLIDIPLFLSIVDYI